MGSTAVQWIHILCAVLAVGGIAFVRLVLMPSVREMPEEQRNDLMPRVHGRFRQVLWLSIGGLLLTGLFNVGQVASRGGLTVPGYAGALAIKIGLALVVFAVAFMLTIPGRAFEGLQRRRPLWLTVNLVLGIVILFLSAYLRRM